jgi:hypothetical protein
MKNWLHMHLPKVTKTALGPLGVNISALLLLQLFLMACKYI